MAEPARLQTDSTTLPDWPLLMDRPTARAFLTLSSREFAAAERTGHIPPPRQALGVPRWHRDELCACMSRIWGITRHDEIALAHAAADAALAAFEP